MKQRLCFFIWGGWLAGVIGLAQQPPPKPSEGDRYLFVVDTSLAMVPLKETLRNTVYDLIYSGLDGQTKRGDSLGVWAFNEQTYPQPFPPLDWSPERRENLAAQAYEFLKTRRFEKRSRPEVLWKDLTPLLKGSRRLTVFVLSNGAQPIVGTPFDDLVNAVYRERGATLRQAGKPVITVLAAREGQIAAWAVTTVGESLVLPLPASVASVVEGDTTLPDSSRATPATVAKADSATASSKIEPKKEIPVPPARMVVVPPVKTESEPIAPALPAAPPQDTPVAGKPESESSGVRPAAKPADEVAAPLAGPLRELDQAMPLTTANASKPSSWVDLQSASTSQPTRPAHSSQAPTELARAAEPAAAPLHWGFLSIGAGLALAAMTLVILLIRLNRRTCQPSYISQSISHERR